MSEEFVEYPCAKCGKSRPGLEEPCSDCGWKPDPIERRTTFRRYRAAQIPDWRVPTSILFIDALSKLPLLTVLGLMLGLSAVFWTLILLLFFDPSESRVTLGIAAGLLQLCSGCCFAGSAGLIKRTKTNRTLIAAAVISESAAIILAAVGFLQFSGW